VLPIVDGKIEKIDWSVKTNSHTYTNLGRYKVSVLENGITIFNYETSGAHHLTECTSFGEIGLTDLPGFFWCVHFSKGSTWKT